MAGDWIKMRGNLWDDPRVLRLCDDTDSTEAAVVGALYWLWATADQHTEDGIMPGLTLRTIDRKTGVQGLGEALVQIGWLADHQDGVRLVRFLEHNGESAKRRCTDAKRKASGRKTSAGARTEAGHAADDPRQTAELEKEKEKEVKSTPPVLGDPAADQLPGPARHDCPHQEIIALYHEILPQCPQVRDWTPARQTALRARWNEDPKRQNLTYWHRFFEYVAKCDFLVGRGKTPFFADLEWITRSANFTKIREEKYANRA